MAIVERMKKLREIRKMKQSDVAKKMKLSSQAYSHLENKGNLKFSAVERFCKAIGVQPVLLLDEKVPINEETLRFFDTLKDEPLLTRFEKLKIKTEAYEKLLV